MPASPDPVERLIRRIPTAESSSGPGYSWARTEPAAPAPGALAPVRAPAGPVAAAAPRPTDLGRTRYPSGGAEPRRPAREQVPAVGTGRAIPGGGTTLVPPNRPSVSGGERWIQPEIVTTGTGWWERPGRERGGRGGHGWGDEWWSAGCWGAPHHLPACWWALGWCHGGYSPWYLSWDLGWNWMPWWRRHYMIWSNAYPSCYSPYYAVSCLPFGAAYGLDWLYGYSFPYAYVWLNVEGYQDGWYVPYESRVVIRIEQGGEAAAGEVASERAPDSAAEVARRYVRLGDAYFLDERYPESADAYLRALTYAPSSPSVYFALADSLFAAGDYHYAAYAIRKGVTMDPGLARGTVDKRTFYRDPARFLEHVAKLEAWVADHPRDGDAWLVLGFNRLYSNDLKGAGEAFRQVAELVPGDRAVEIFLAGLAARPASAPAAL